METIQAIQTLEQFDFPARVVCMILAIIVLGLTCALACAVFRLWVQDQIEARQHASQLVTRSNKTR